jgi:hypothetical protein
MPAVEPGVRILKSTFRARDSSREDFLQQDHTETRFPGTRHSHDDAVGGQSMAW